MRLLKGYQPLCLMDEKVLLYKKSKMFLYDYKYDNFELVFRFEIGLSTKVKEGFRLLSRVFRTGIRSALAINQDEVLFVAERNLCYLNIGENKLKKLYKIKSGFSDPLNLCKPVIEGKGFVALFGDYGDNKKREEVSIYGIHKDLTIQVLYTFKAGTIRHIHNIVRDDLKNGYYIFAGDNEPNAGIYWADINFKIMKPIIVGAQKARAVCGFMTNKGLLYATDSVSSQNYIYLLIENNNKPVLLEVVPINGSCIYATKYSGGYVFSTTVESPENNGSRISNLLSIKRGKGILSNDVHLVHVTPQLETNIIGTYRKDKLPYKLFQYGVVRFPSGQENSNILIMYPCAVKNFDGSTVIMDSNK